MGAAACGHSVWCERHSEFGGAYVLSTPTMEPLPSFLGAPGRKMVCIELSGRTKAGTLVVRPQLFYVSGASHPTCAPKKKRRPF